MAITAQSLFEKAGAKRKDTLQVARRSFQVAQTSPSVIARIRHELRGIKLK